MNVLNKIEGISKIIFLICVNGNENVFKMRKHEYHYSGAFVLRQRNQKKIFSKDET